MGIQLELIISLRHRNGILRVRLVFLRVIDIVMVRRWFLNKNKTFKSTGTF